MEHVRGESTPFWKRWIPVLLWAGLIFAFSSFPDLQSGAGPTWDLVLRKLAHTFEFAVLALLFARAQALVDPQPHVGTALTVAWIVTVIYAASDEWHQSMVPGRMGAALDVAIDASGALIGVLIATWWYFPRTLRRGPPTTSKPKIPPLL